MAEEIVHIGKRRVWGGEAPFSLCGPDRRHHAYVIGKSGTGKTTLLRNLIVQDIEAGRGVAVIDVHGDLARELLEFIPPYRIDDVVFFNPEDSAFPIGLNPFAGVKEENRHVVA